ncbi:NTP transferase domain-containing protein [Pseudonocardia xinjiangensis]|nr:NTP transferase domain-containing protein [Pseudonocardia xinjiangensis]
MSSHSVAPDDGSAAGIVLAGGRSSRMGESKAALEWHGSTLLRRTTGLLARTVDGPVVVVRAPGQALPALPAGVETVDDPVEGRGPMQGIAIGLAALSDRARIAFVCSTDLPFLHPAYVRRVLSALDAEVDVVLPHAGGHRQPLAAAYRTALAPVVAGMVTHGQLKLAMLFDHCRVRRIDDAGLLADPRLRALDPELDSVLNVNEPDDYRVARARPAPEITVQRFGALASGGKRGPTVVEAATLGAAAAAVGLPLDRHVVAALNGDQITRDAEMPLVAGDTVAFLSADAGG